jgi:hypothetical protein
MISYRSPILSGKKETEISSLEPLADRNEPIKRLWLSSLAKFTNAIEAIKINAMSLEKRGNRLMCVKRRQPGSGFVVLFANLFFRLAGAQIHLWISLKKWQSWEIACFRLLYGRTLQVYPEGKRTVCAEKVPGISLRDCVIKSTLAIPAIEAAGKELRRAHGLWCRELGDYWSHGDPHLENLIYNPQTGHARLIDFELIHHKSLPALKRHADDLLVFLQDLMSCVTAEEWIPFARTLIDAYDQPAVVNEVRKRLIVPRGWSAIWWKLRTDYLSRDLMIERINSLQTALSQNCTLPGRRRYAIACPYMKLSADYADYTD